MGPKKVSLPAEADIFGTVFRPALKLANSAVASDKRVFLPRQPENRLGPKIVGYASRETFYGIVSV